MGGRGDGEGRGDAPLSPLLPEYITPELLNETVVRAGRLIGLGDFRPDFGTFQLQKFEVLKEE